MRCCSRPGRSRAGTATSSATCRGGRSRRSSGSCSAEPTGRRPGGVQPCKITGGSGGRRQVDDHARAGSGVLHPDPPAVLVHDVADDREPQPGAADVAAARLVEPHEPVEDPLARLGGMPGPSSVTTRTASPSAADRPTVTPVRACRVALSSRLSTTRESASASPSSLAAATPAASTGRRPSRRPTLLLSAVLVLVPFAVLLGLVMARWQPLRALDRGVTEAVQDLVADQPAVAVVMQAVTCLGDGATWWALLSVTTRSRRRLEPGCPRRALDQRRHRRLAAVRGLGAGHGGALPGLASGLQNRQPRQRPTVCMTQDGRRHG